MNNKEIDNLANSNKYTYRGYYGCLPFNELPIVEIKDFPTVFVLNTCSIDEDDSYIRPCHWFVVYVDKKIIRIFDSAGGSNFKNLEPVEKFLEKQKKLVIFNRVQIQSPESSACGIFCLLFIFAMSLKINFEKFISLFKTQNLDKNDEIAFSLFRCAFLETDSKCFKDINEMKLKKNV